MEKTTLSSKGQIVLPAGLRRRDVLRPGEEFEIERLDEGEYRLKRLSPAPNRGLVDLLLACPAKGWFRPMPRAESTGDLRVPELG